MRAFAVLIVLLAGTAAARAGYRVENVTLPSGLRGGIASVAWTPAGTLVLSTRYGEIWMRSPDGKSWHRFAYGLNEPMGLVAESEKVVYVAHRPELLRVTDENGDGKADRFDALGGDWGLSQNYHEFFFGLRRDQQGHFYGAVSLDSSGEKGAANETRGVRDLRPAVEAAYHGSELPRRGWAVEITPDGTTIPYASGFRQPNGVGMSPDGDLFFTDNQGDYKPSCGLLHVTRGDFHGHAESLKWEPGYKAGSLNPGNLWRRYKAPAVVFPHGAMGVSSGEPVWDLSQGKFGPYGGQVFVGDFTNLVMRISLEKIGGEWQGAVLPFLGRNELAPYASGEHLAQGNTRAAFAPDGSLYLGQTAGWGGGSDGLQRVVWDGKISADVSTLRLTKNGFALRFTKPMQREQVADPSRYEINRFRYYYHVKYGSPRIDEAPVKITSINVDADGKGAELILDQLQVGFVYEMSLGDVRAEDGEALVNPIAYYTANRLLTGEIAIGGTTRLPQPGESSLGAKEADAVLSSASLIATGAKVYRNFCMACHQANGKGLPGGAANFVDDKSRLAKSDAALMVSITKGIETKGMPAFGSSLPKGQQRAVLAYLRATFGDKPAASDNPDHP